MSDFSLILEETWINRIRMLFYQNLELPQSSDSARGRDENSKTHKYTVCFNFRVANCSTQANIYVSKYIFLLLSQSPTGGLATMAGQKHFVMLKLPWDETCWIKKAGSSNNKQMGSIFHPMTGLRCDTLAWNKKKSVRNLLFHLTTA